MGKSIIVKRLAEDFKSLKVPVVDINLREVSFDSVDTLVQTLREKTNSWLEQFLETPRHFNLDAELYNFSVKLKIDQPSAPSLAKLNNMSSNLQKKLPLNTFWHGTKVLVFIIEKLTSYRDLLKTQKDSTWLESSIRVIITC